MRPQIEAEIAHFGLGDRVWLAGERKDIPDVIRAMDVFVLPSRAEGISNTMIEAMACGVPVVATEVGGNAELVDHGCTGGLAPPNNSEALAAILERYVKDADLRAKHGLAARERIEANFSIEHMVNSYQDLYMQQLRLYATATARGCRESCRSRGQGGVVSEGFLSARLIPNVGRKG